MHAEQKIKGNNWKCNTSQPTNEVNCQKLTKKLQTVKKLGKDKRQKIISLRYSVVKIKNRVVINQENVKRNNTNEEIAEDK